MVLNGAGHPAMHQAVKHLAMYQSSPQYCQSPASVILDIALVTDSGQGRHLNEHLGASVTLLNPAH